MDRDSSDTCMLHRSSHVRLVATLGCSPPESSVHVGSPGKNTGGVAMPYVRGSSPPRDQTRISYVSCIGRWFFTTSATWEALHGIGRH